MAERNPRPPLLAVGAPLAGRPFRFGLEQNGTRNGMTLVGPQGKGYILCLKRCSFTSKADLSS